jgi:hypothetical protein
MMIDSESVNKESNGAIQVEHHSHFESRRWDDCISIDGWNYSESCVTLALMKQSTDDTWRSAIFSERSNRPDRQRWNPSWFVIDRSISGVPLHRLLIEMRMHRLEVWLEDEHCYLTTELECFTTRDMYREGDIVFVWGRQPAIGQFDHTTRTFLSDFVGLFIVEYRLLDQFEK